MARHALSRLLPVAAKTNLHAYEVLARHVLSVQGESIIADMHRVKSETGDVKRLDLFRLAAKYQIPFTTLMKWLESLGAVRAGLNDQIYTALGFLGVREAYTRAALDSGLLPHDGVTLEFTEHGLALSDIEKGFEFFWLIHQDGQPRFRGKHPQTLRMLDHPYIERIKGRGVYLYSPNTGYNVQSDWYKSFRQLYPVAHAVWTLGGLNAS